MAFTHSGCAATYAWRHSSTSGDVEKIGKGDVWEQYATKEIVGRPATGVDVGKPWVVAGPYRVKWSCSQQNFGYIYPELGGVEALKIPNMQLREFRFP